MAGVPSIAEFMTTMPMTVAGTEPVKAAKKIMSVHTIRHLPVVEGGRLIGIISDRDIKLAQAVARQDDFDEAVLVKDICQLRPYVVGATMRADRVLAHMAEERIGSALITDGRKLIGIFTVTDACRGFAQYLRSSLVGSDSD